MVRFLPAVAVLLLWQDMPVVKLAGGAPAQTQATQPTRPQTPGGMPVTQLDPGSVAATLDSPRRLTLRFAEPRPIQEVLQLVVAGTRFSLAIDPDVNGAFRGELKDLTLRETLTTLLEPLGLDFEVRGTIIRVTRHRSETRQFDVNLLAVQRTLTRAAGEGGATLASTAGGDDVFASLNEGVQALLSSSGKVHVDRHAGLVQVTDFPDRLDRVALYLEGLQVRSSRQVRLQARVFEVALRTGSAIDWSLVRQKLGLPPDAAEAGIAADPAALQAALAAQGEIRPLSAPDVTAMNNEPALMRIGTPGVSSLTLTVVAQIAADGIVQLHVSHAWEEHARDQKEGWLKSTPISRTAEADTVTRVMDGRTVLIAGLTRPTEVATEARGVAALFGAQPKKTVQSELVILLRPTVVSAGTR